MIDFLLKMGLGIIYGLLSLLWVFMLIRMVGYAVIETIKDYRKIPK